MTIETELPAVKVKALEWDRIVLGERDDIPGLKASNAVNQSYYITERDGRFNYQRKSFDTVEAAKAAAQADYERRILSALTLKDDPGNEGDVEVERGKAEAFDRICAARKKHVDSVAAYNARRELANAERMRGSWAIKLDEEYHAMSDAQSEFHRTVQDLADAAIRALIPEREE